MSHNSHGQSLMPLGGGRDAFAHRQPNRFDQAARMHTLIQRCTMVLRRRWWILPFSLALVGGPSLIYAWSKPPTFESKAVMWMAGKLNLPDGRLLSEEWSTYMDTQSELIRSAVVQERALQKVLERHLGAGGSEASGKTMFVLTVHSSAKGAVLELRATGPTAEGAQAFLDGVMAEYLAMKRESRKQTSLSALSIVSDQISGLEKQIRQQQNQITAFRMSNNLSYLTEHGLSAGSHLSKLTELLSDLKTEHRLLEIMTPAQFNAVADGVQTSPSNVTVPGEKAARATAMNSLASQSAYYLALQQVQVLKAKRDEFSAVLRPTHSKMVKLSQEIAGLEQLLKTLHEDGEQLALSQMAHRKQSLELQIENMEGQYRTWETNAAEASGKLAEYERMNREAQRSQALYDHLVSLLQTVDLNQNLDQEPLTPLGPAAAGQRASSRHKIAIAGLFLGCVLGGGLLLILGILDDRFASPDELSVQLTEETVGHIPESLPYRRRVGQRLPKPDEEEHAFAESFRDLRSSLFFTFRETAKPAVILIASAIPNEGKTTVAANLSCTLALSGARVLLIDADLRRGAVHRLFEVPLKPGLAEVLNREIASHQAIVATNQPGLFVMSAGDLGHEDPDAFLRARVELLLRELASQYDFIIIDSAPMLATDDAAYIAPFADGVFFVVRVAHSSARTVNAALDRLRRRNARVLGTVCNCAPRSADYYSEKTAEALRT